MDFTFNAEQDELRRSVRDFLERESPPAYVATMTDDERGFTDDVWDHIVALGWPSLLVPETHGGLGLGLVDLVVVMEEMGRVPFPGEYAKVRVQFDRPIATFQVIKHKAADMLHRLELARVGTHYAAWASDADDDVRAEAAAMAKSYVAEAANYVTAESIQIHGGVGFTWDCDAHLHYRKAKQADLLLGYQGWQRQRLADLVLDG
jgi:alkylation response protein AidB-like acyl-CoA dehydrogenase